MVAIALIGVVAIAADGAVDIAQGVCSRVDYRPMPPIVHALTIGVCSRVDHGAVSIAIVTG